MRDIVCVQRAGTLIKRWLRPTAAFLATLSAAVLVATMAGTSVFFSVLSSNIFASPYPLSSCTWGGFKKVVGADVYLLCVKEI